MRLRTEDMAKFMHFLAQKGEWEGRRLLHPAWFEAACRKQIDTPGDPSRPDGEWGWGYGFQCWMGSVPGSFRADGAYGQFGFLYPDLELEIITTARCSVRRYWWIVSRKRCFRRWGERRLP